VIKDRIFFNAWNVWIICKHWKMTKIQKIFFECRSFFLHNQKTAQGEGVVSMSWRGEEMRKCCKKVNSIQILCIPAYKYKSDTCWNSSRNAVKGVNSSMIYLILCKNFCKCHKVPLPSTTNKNKEKTKRKTKLHFQEKCA
jgi:hypothetical protein